MTVDITPDVTQSERGGDGVGLDPVSLSRRDGVGLDPVSLSRGDGVGLDPVSLSRGDGVGLDHVSLSQRDGVGLDPVSLSRTVEECQARRPRKDSRHVTSHHEQPPKKSRWRLLRGCALCLFRPYDLYVVSLLSLMYVSAVMCCFVIAAVAIPISQQIGFGEMGCITNFTQSMILNRDCDMMETQEDCENYNNHSALNPCMWYYNGQGFSYELLAGPLFDVVLAAGSLVMGFVADHYNRRDLLVFSCLCWSAISALTGTVTDYWHIIILRFALAVGESGCTPFATSILADYFHDQLLGLALGIYYWGFNVGYGLSFVLGNFLTWQRVWGDGWRWAFYLAGIPGFALSVLGMMTLKEPVRSDVRNINTVGTFVPLLEGELTLGNHIKQALKFFFRKEIILITLAAGVRQGACFVWLYNCDVYYESLGQRAVQIGTYMSWSPILGGSLGLVIGSFISDSFAEMWGTSSRVLVVIISQTLAVPFCVATLLLPAPVTYFMDIPAQILGELWVSTTLAFIIEVTPLSVRTSVIGLFLFLIDFIAGWACAFVPFIQGLFEEYGDRMDTRAFRYTLLLMYPGGYALSTMFYCLALCTLMTGCIVTEEDPEIKKEHEKGVNLSKEKPSSEGYIFDEIVRPPSYGSTSDHTTIQLVERMRRGNTGLYPDLTQMDADITQMNYDVTLTDADVTQVDRDVTQADSDVTYSERIITNPEVDSTRSDSDITNVDADVTQQPDSDIAQPADDVKHSDTENYLSDVT